MAKKRKHADVLVKVSVEDRIKEIVSWFVFGDYAVDMEANAEELGLDSQDVVEIIMLVEEAFSISISPQVAESFTSSEDIVQHVKQISQGAEQ